MNTTNHHNANQDNDSESGLGLEDFLTLLRFIYNAVLRHKLLIGVCIVVVSALVFGAIKVMPRTYRVSSKILIHASTTISRLAKTGNELRQRDAVFGLVELMKSQENLEGIVDDADLVDKWKKTRYGLRKKKDEIFRNLFGPLKDEDIREALVAQMEGSLRADFSGGVLETKVDWGDPWVALEIQKVVTTRFFEERRIHELGEIGETIQLLEEKYKQALSDLQAIIEKSRNLANEKATLEIKQEKPSPTKSRVVSRPSRISPPLGLSTEQKEELEALSAELTSVQTEIARLQADYKRRLSSEHDKLAQYETQYGPQHPEIIKTKRYIELLSAQEPVPDSLRRKERSVQKLVENLQNPQPTTEETGTKRRRIAKTRTTDVDKKENELEIPSENELAALLFESDLMTSEYRDAEEKVNRLKTQLENARLERDATEAAFTYRYRLTKPPVFPRRPVKPKGLQLMLAGVLLSILLGISLAVFVDIRSGIILESWQIEKTTNVPLLGEIDEPR